ncbi:MAG: 2-oxoglutarate dehydrogenase complex dihydrolipoyllysine-residue succinyltransferase [Planctomycetota bacterium]
MPTEIKIPSVGESVTEVQIGNWLVSEGDGVSADETLVEIESDKATVELPAPAQGTIAKILEEGVAQTANVGEVIALLEEGASSGGSKEEAREPQTAGAKGGSAQGATNGGPQGATKGGGNASKGGDATRGSKDGGGDGRNGSGGHVMPAAARLAADTGVDTSKVEGSGPGGRVLKEDVQRVAASNEQPKAGSPSKHAVVGGAPSSNGAARGSRDEETVPMTMLRRRIAQNLVQAQQNAALLTTFNEIDMSAVMALRNEHKDSFEKKYGVKLGFMSFFVRAAVDALRLVPAINAEVRGTDIVYRHYHDVGIAVGGGKGLVVPVLRNAESMSFADIEVAIGDFGRRAKDNKISIEELTGGTFTISNGGIYGSLLSTPIVNPPQSGILGLHAIQERPVAIDGKVEIRPMMYVALTYDHRLVDGREAVTFLKRIKDCIENPSRMLLEI